MHPVGWEVGLVDAGDLNFFAGMEGFVGAWSGGCLGGGSGSREDEGLDLLVELWWEIFQEGFEVNDGFGVFGLSGRSAGEGVQHGWFFVTFQSEEVAVLAKQEVGGRCCWLFATVRTFKSACKRKFYGAQQVNTDVIFTCELSSRRGMI